MFNNLVNTSFFTKIEFYLVRSLPILLLISLGYGLYLALLVAPDDYQQGNSVKIMYIHVPAAWTSMLGYLICSIFAFSYLVWRNNLAALVVKESARIGSIFAFITLVTGSIWGKPMWGTWWVWDARLTSVLVLFFIYISVLSLFSATSNNRKNYQIACIFTLIGAINLPIIKFSVYYWNTLHQGSSIIRLSGPSIDKSMLLPLLIMMVAFKLLFFLLLIMGIRIELNALRKERLEIMSLAKLEK